YSSTRRSAAYSFASATVVQLLLGNVLNPGVAFVVVEQRPDLLGRCGLQCRASGVVHRRVVARPEVVGVVRCARLLVLVLVLGLERAAPGRHGRHGGDDRVIPPAPTGAALRHGRDRLAILHPSLSGERRAGDVGLPALPRFEAVLVVRHVDDSHGYRSSSLSSCFERTRAIMLISSCPSWRMAAYSRVRLSS